MAEAELITTQVASRIHVETIAILQETLAIWRSRSSGRAGMSCNPSSVPYQVLAASTRAWRRRMSV